jgi:hypothetical protein
MISEIHAFFADRPNDFERCAAASVRMVLPDIEAMDPPVHPAMAAAVELENLISAAARAESSPRYYGDCLRSARLRRDQR